MLTRETTRISKALLRPAPSSRGVTSFRGSSAAAWPPVRSKPMKQHFRFSSQRRSESSFSRASSYEPYISRWWPAERGDLSSYPTIRGPAWICRGDVVRQWTSLRRLSTIVERSRDVEDDSCSKPLIGGEADGSTWSKRKICRFDYSLLIYRRLYGPILIHLTYSDDKSLIWIVMDALVPLRRLQLCTLFRRSVAVGYHHP